MRESFAMIYQYRIAHINRNERWISLSSNSEYDCEDIEPFVFFLKKISGDVGGEIEDIGDLRYLIHNDGLGLIYQWDSCFGISVIYPDHATEKMVIKFLEKYI